MSFGAVAASVAGAAVGGLMGGGGGGGGEVNKAPWDPAIKPLINTLTTGPQLEAIYQQNPFNPLQQTGYQNLFSDLDNFRTNLAPQAQAFNNRLMGANYTRAPAGSELGGSMRQIDASQFLPPEQRMQMTKPMQMGGLLGYGSQPAQASAAQGLLGLTVVPTSNNSLYGQPNWKELNPHTATNGIPKTPVQTNTGMDLTDDQAFAAAYDRLLRQREQESNRYYGGGGS